MIVHCFVFLFFFFLASASRARQIVAQRVRIARMPIAASQNPYISILPLSLSLSLSVPRFAVPHY